MPGVGKAAQAVVATRRFEDSLHASMMTIVPCLCKTMGAARSAVGNAIRAIRQDPAKFGPVIELQEHIRGIFWLIWCICGRYRERM